MASPNQFSRPESVEASFSAQLAAQQNQRAKDLAAKEKQKAKETLQDAQDAVNKLVERKKNTDASLSVEKNYLLTLKYNATLSTGPGGATITPTELAAIQAQEAVVAAKQNQLNQIITSLNTAWQKVQTVAQQLNGSVTSKPKAIVNNAKTNKTTTKSKSVYLNENSGGQSGNSGPISNAGLSDVYYYNAPMVRTAYINPRGPQTQSTDTSMSGSDNPKSADIAWTSLFSSKGIIQMNRETALIYANNMRKNNMSYDDNLYGFRFLYNPKEVSMSWGVTEGVNYEGVASGLDPFSPITPALINSTVSFSLMLNRTNDMAWLDTNGLIPGVTDPYPTFNTKDKQKELAEIYKRGTMYDLEYLFKAIMGVNSVHDSKLNGKTADYGWLQGVAVELHLGAGMKYLVRISSLEVNHMIFNERMVPLLSTLNVSCTRFNDFISAT